MSKIILTLLLTMSFGCFAVDIQKINSYAYKNRYEREVKGFTIGFITPEKVTQSLAPPADAFRGVLYGHEVAIYHNTIFEGEAYGYKAVVKNGADWLYLENPHYYIEQLKSRQDCYDIAEIMIGVINETAYNVLRDPNGGGGSEPEFGIELMKWILSNKVAVSSDEIIIN